MYKSHKVQLKNLILLVYLVLLPTVSLEILSKSVENDYKDSGTLNSDDLIPDYILQKASSVETTNPSDGYCLYSYDPQNRYSCFLFHARITSSIQVLNITGDHLLNHNDEDVLLVRQVNARIQFFNGEILRKFKNLKSINMQGTDMRVISSDSFSVNCENLEEMNISNNNVTRLPNGLFSNCRNLKVLRAIFSRISEIPEDLFGATTSLEELYLGINRLTSIPENLLRNMQNLRIFSVDENQLTDIAPSVLANARNLEEFKIFWNNINDSVSLEQTLYGHFNLRVLNINRNPLSNFNFTFLGTFDKLEGLNVHASQGNVNLLWSALPRTMKSFTIWDIEEELPENAFSRFQNLENLTFRGSGITKIHKDAFKELPELQKLHISRANFTTLDPQTFTSQSKLRSLSLSFCELEELPKGIFEPLASLGLNEEFEGLTIVETKLQSLSLDMFGYHPHLRNINLAVNQINKIQRGIFERFNPVLNYVSLAGNKCTSSSFYEVSNLDENEQLEWCFNNFDGITTTTTTDGANGLKFRRDNAFGIIFVGLIWLIINLWK